MFAGELACEANRLTTTVPVTEVANEYASDQSGRMGMKARDSIKIHSKYMDDYVHATAMQGRKRCQVRHSPHSNR